jgi:hypothetical protein
VKAKRAGRRCTSRGARLSVVWVLSLAAVGAAPTRGWAQAQNGSISSTSSAVSGPAPAPPPPPYSLPWQLRPVVAANVVRSDTTVSFHEVGGNSASTLASTLLFSYKLAPRFAPLVRMAYIHNAPGSAPGTGNAVVNPLVGATSSFDLAPGLRLGVFLGFTIPIGQGGDAPAGMNATAAAAAAGINARSAMDNALFAVNYFTAIPGVGLAYMRAGFTAQLEATLLQLVRVRNSAIEKDKSRTNFTSGLHLGYFVIPMLSLGGELRFQRWLSDPAFLAMWPERRETLSFALGPRAHFKLGNRWLRPGIAYAQGIDAPMKTRKDRIIQLDIPFVF